MKKALALDVGGTKIYNAIINENGAIISEIEIVPRSIDGSMDGILMKCSVALITEVDISKGL